MRCGIRSRQAMCLGGGILLTVSLAAQMEEHIPRALQPPSAQMLLFSLHGKGDQIYVCESTAGGYAWKLKAPDAKLFDLKGQAAGRHFAGPTWEANDGSRVMGKLAASVPSLDLHSVPWLLLTATSHDSTGAMTHVQSIQRLNTQGGLAPGSLCSAANERAETRAPYEADYHFYGDSQ